MLKTLSGVFRRVATKAELNEAEGRRCVLAISGLKHTRKVYYFQITGSTIEVVDPYATYNTLIIAPIDSVIRVFKGIAAGNKYAFSEERARGEAIVKGERSLHDALVLGDAFKRFAELASRYGGGKI